jgi:hypothetical protein
MKKPCTCPHRQKKGYYCRHKKWIKSEFAMGGYKKPKKCLCGHFASKHYVSDVDVSRGKVFCGADNCHNWDRCDIKL